MFRAILALINTISFILDLFTLEQRLQCMNRLVNQFYFGCIGWEDLDSTDSNFTHITTVTTQQLQNASIIPNIKPNRNNQKCKGNIQRPARTSTMKSLPLYNVLSLESITCILNKETQALH
eukprot:1062208_1